MRGIALRRPYPVLDNGDAARIQRAALTGLERVGVCIGTARGRSLLKKAGAQVDERTHAAKIPESLVKDLVKESPSRVRLHARNPETDVEPDLGAVHLCHAAT